MKTINRIDGLDGLRFYSFIFILINHVYDLFQMKGIDIEKPFMVKQLGIYAVVYFFCGSGFLITFMLFVEKGVTNTFKLKNFYLRRIFRIWPGYFITVIITILIYMISVKKGFRFFELDYLPLTFGGLILYFIIQPHLFLYFNIKSFLYLHHLYTIGIEEQFYFIWAILFKFFAKKFKLALAILFAFGIIFEIIYYFNFASENVFTKREIILRSICHYYNLSHITTFCIGSFLAMAYYQKKNWLSFFYNIYFQILFYIIFLVICIFNFNLPVFNSEFRAIVMAVLLLIVSNKQKSILKVYQKSVNYLGVISYGMYLFHMLSIAIMLTLVEKWNLLNNSIVSLGLVTISSGLLSFILGYLSFNFVDKYFLAIKKKFDFIKGK